MSNGGCDHNSYHLSVYCVPRVAKSFTHITWNIPGLSSLGYFTPVSMNQVIHILPITTAFGPYGWKLTPLSFFMSPQNLWVSHMCSGQIYLAFLIKELAFLLKALLLSSMKTFFFFWSPWKHFLFLVMHSSYTLMVGRSPQSNRSGPQWNVERWAWD